MAPELFEGGRASPASDQFAFCVALFVALFDKHPFKAGEGIALSELITRVRAGTLQKPSLPNAASERLFGVLRRGFAATPSARFGDLPELLAALERAAGKQRRGVALGLGVLGLLLAGLVAARFASRVGATSQPETAASGAGAMVVAVPVDSTPSHGVADLAAASGGAPSAPSASSPALSASPSAGSEKRRPPKPTDVRYKDWLKDPF